MPARMFLARCQNEPRDHSAGGEVSLARDASTLYCFFSVTLRARTSPPALIVVCSDPSGSRE